MIGVCPRASASSMRKSRWYPGKMPATWGSLNNHPRMHGTESSSQDTRGARGGGLPSATECRIVELRHLHIIGISGALVPAAGCDRSGATFF